MDVIKKKNKEKKENGKRLKTENGEEENKEGKKIKKGENEVK